MAEPNLRPYQESDPESGSGGQHLSDYWQIITRRMWLVLLIFGVTAASTIWAVSRQQVFYQASLALQINDPLERTRSLVPYTRVSAMQLYIDPVQSELEVLRSGAVAGTVVDELGLRLRTGDPDIPISLLTREVTVDAEVPEGTYELVYDAEGSTVQLRDAAGTVLGSGAVGTPLDAGGIRFTPLSPPGEDRTYTVTLVPRQEAVRAVRQNISATPRSNTNIIDVNFLSPDPQLAPQVLNRSVESLREHGARRVQMVASQEVQFIEDRLEAAQDELRGSLAAIRTFKETEAFGNLSQREQALLEQSQELMDRIEELTRRRTIYNQTLDKLSTAGLTQSDLVRLTAELAEVTNDQLHSTLSELRSRHGAVRALQGQGRGANHPDVRTAQSEIERLEGELTEVIAASLTVTESRLSNLDRQLEEVNQRQRQFPALENELQTLRVQQTTDEETYRFLLTQLQQARITEAAANPYVDIIDPAVGATPIQPRGTVNILLGGLLGLILGLGAAFFLEYLDRTVRTSSDVETLLGIPVLGVIPRLRRVAEEQGGGQRRPAPLIVALDPLDPAAEAYRNLRMNLMFMSTEESPARSIVVTSAGPEEGKSTTALNFAIMLAQQGQKVLLVDADLRRPALHRSLDLLKEPGLTNLLVGEMEPKAAIRPNVLPNLDFLPAGAFPPNPSELLNSRTMHRLLKDLEGRYAHVVVDSPPVLAVTDAALISTHTDGVLLVLRSGETEQKAAERTVDQLQRIGVRVFGAVLNEVAAASSEEGYYLQYYHNYDPPSSKRSGWQRLRQGVGRARFW